MKRKEAKERLLLQLLKYIHTPYFTLEINNYSTWTSNRLKQLLDSIQKPENLSLSISSTTETKLSYSAVAPS